MKAYEPYLLDEAEILLHETHKELSVDGFYGSRLTEVEIQANRLQHEIISAVFHSSMYFTQREKFELSTCHFYSFSEIISQDNVKSIEIESPRLSREKLLGLSTYDLSLVIISLIKDYENWDKTLKQSFMINL